MMRLKTLLVAVIVLAGTAVALEPSDYKAYGNCTTATITDPMSDETGAVFFCNTGAAIFGISRDPGDTVLTVGVLNEATKEVAGHFSLGELAESHGIEVRLRVDKGEVHAASAQLAADGFLYIHDGVLAKVLIKQVAGGRKLYFSVQGSASDTVDLDGPAAAIDGMTRRLQASGP